MKSYRISVLIIFSFVFVACVPSELQYRNISLKRKQIVYTAKHFVGVPYRHGGTTPSGFDCSGYVYYVYAKNGIAIPRSTYDQYQKGQKIPFRLAQPGDLLFFRIYNNKISHVGIFVGNNTFIHAPSSGKTVRYDTVTNPYWKSRFSGAVSYFKTPIKGTGIMQSDSYREERFVW